MAQAREKIGMAIYGYGELGKSTLDELGRHLEFSENVEARVIFSNRADGIREKVQKVCARRGIPMPELLGYDQLERVAAEGNIDVLAYCGDSKDGYLPAARKLAKLFPCLVDTFDDHPIFVNVKEELDAIAKANGSTIIMGHGWSPGLLSDIVMLIKNNLPGCNAITAYGHDLGGGSRGHRDAILGVGGVLDAVSVTTFDFGVVEAFTKGEKDKVTSQDLHLRTNYVALKEGIDPDTVKKSIATMERYFAGFRVETNIVSLDQIAILKETYKRHSGKIVARRPEEDGQATTMSFEMFTPSNTMMTAGILLGGAIAADKMHKEGKTGAFVSAQASITDQSRKSDAEQIKGY